MLENINPEFMKFKHVGTELTNLNSLGFDTYQKLIMLGFWKKCLYQLDY